MATERLSAPRLIAYAGPSIPAGALTLPLLVYLPPFYAGPMGLGLGAVGTIFMLARIWDFVTDPAFGVLSDRFPSRWGRRRHWLVISVPVLMVPSWFIFFPASPVSPTYLVVGLFGVYLGFTMMLLTQMSWGAELDDDYHERSRIQAYREGFMVLSIMLALTIPAIIEWAGGENVETDRVAAMGWLIMLTTPLTVLFAVLFVGEHKQRPQAHLPMRQALTSLGKNKALRRVVIADLANGFGSSAGAALFIYVVTLVWQLGNYASLLMLLFFVTGTAFIPAAVKVSYRFGKHRTLIAASLFNVCFVPTLLLIPPGNIAIAAFVLAVLGIMVAVPNMLFRSIMADVCDYDEVHSGQRRTGFFYSLLTMTLKLGGALSIGVTYWILDLIGFDPTGGNSTETLAQLTLLYAGAPFICNLVIVFIMWGFPIGQDEQKELRRILEARSVSNRQGDRT